MTQLRLPFLALVLCCNACSTVVVNRPDEAAASLQWQSQYEVSDAPSVDEHVRVNGEEVMASTRLIRDQIEARIWRVKPGRLLIATATMRGLGGNRVADGSAVVFSPTAKCQAVVAVNAEAGGEYRLLFDQKSTDACTLFCWHILPSGAVRCEDSQAASKPSAP